MNWGIIGLGHMAKNFARSIKELNNTKLEFEYLSSTEKLLEYQSQFFEKNLVQKNINKIKTLTKKSDSLFITNLDFFESNEKK